MGEDQKQPFQLSFNRFLRVAFQGSRVTSNGGLIVVRELDGRLGFGELMEQHLTDSWASNARFSFADLLRQSVYSRLAGYEDVNDAERLSQDPTFRLIGSEKIWDRGAALTSRLQTFETEVLAKEDNFAGLARLNRELIAGKSCCCRKLSASGCGERKLRFEPPLPLPSRRFTRPWRSRASSTPSAYRQTKTCRGTSRSC